MAKKYLGSEIKSKQAFLYGRFTSKVKAHRKSGSIQSMFLYKEGSEQKDIAWSEIDIEFVGKHQTQFETNLIYSLPTSPALPYMSEEYHTLNPLYEVWNEFTIEWTPDFIKWYVNDNLIREVYAHKESFIKYFNSEMNIRYNHWLSVSYEWAGEIDNINDESYYIQNFRYSPYNVDTKQFESETIAVEFTSESEFEKYFYKISSPETWDENLSSFDSKNVGVNQSVELKLCRYDKPNLFELLKQKLLPLKVLKNTQISVNQS